MTTLKIPSQRMMEFSKAKPNGLVLVLGIVFFLTVLIIGQAVYDDYGISFDEPTQLEFGILNYRYVMKQDPTLTGWHARYYGPFFEILLVIFQARGSTHDLYLSRHMLNFLCFLAGVGALFLLAKRYIRRTSMALLGCLFLVLSPRLFADAFYNSKDIPFFVFYLFALLTLLWFADRPGPRVFLHGLVSAALITIRIPGLFIAALTLATLLWEVLARRIALVRAIQFAAAYLVTTLAFILLFWPTLWSDPLGGLLQAFQVMSHYPYLTSMRYLGQTITSAQVPWHYILVWMAVTTPLLYLALFGLGLITIFTGWKQQAGKLGAPLRDEVILLAAFWGPLLVVISLGSALYNGWRQMFFIYAPFLIIALKGAEAAVERLLRLFPGRAGRLLLAGILGVGVLPVAGWMLQNHPYQYLYFNPLAGSDYSTIQQRFDMDYWELNYKQGLEYILASDPSSRITVFGETGGGQRNLALFQPEEIERIVFVDRLEDAVYFITNYSRPGETYSFENEVFSAQLGNAKVLSVFRLSQEERQ